MWLTFMIYISLGYMCDNAVLLECSTTRSLNQCALLTDKSLAANTYAVVAFSTFNPDQYHNDMLNETLMLCFSTHVLLMSCQFY